MIEEIEKNKNDLPKDWKWVKLGEVCDKVESVKRKEKKTEEEFIYLDIGGIDNSANKIHSHKTYKWKDAPSRAQQIVFKDDILFSTVRTYMKNIAVVEKEIYDRQIASSGFCVIRSNKKISDSKFIFYYTVSENFLRPLNELQTGSSYPAVRDKDVFIQPFPLPPRPTQQAIVSKIEELFSELDKGIENLRTAQQQLKTYRQSVLKWAFEKLENENTIEEITESSLIGIVRSSKDQNENGTGVPYVKMNNVDLNGKVNFKELVYVEANKNEIDRFHLKKGDILINTRNSFELVGKTGIVREEKTNAIFNNNLLRIRVRNNFLPLFIGYQLINPSLKSQMLKEKKATTNVCALYQRDIFPLRVKICSVEEQNNIVQEIESRLSVADKMEESITQSLRQAEALRQSILKKAFEGRLV